MSYTKCSSIHKRYLEMGCILNNLKMNCLGVAKKKKSAAEKKKSIARHNMKKPEQQKQSEAKTQ